ncbi:BCCT family transporter [Corynebacterium sp. 320]|uniref:choline BCCT transporter BetT n=1 Tax=Corynebacterium TaxID=1716 RepID=UPI00125CC4B4|nr:BCCT family transporter [Corynebacterium sp. 320]KAB1553073.1 BCCT family transporter [Corynebacterium sp. 321]KAB1553709.1 BCCT family transporter [Corynebacterium sp. 319]KAB3527964.1 BCCT family transporter [Corynebacterium sp. 250]KAB3540548.1 BCCT family transporter [Corynebacterium sp. 366]QNP91503.1 choline BCCT transporter BetT [Corynebacterium zhongnanshanii]
MTDHHPPGADAPDTRVIVGDAPVDQGGTTQEPDSDAIRVNWRVFLASAAGILAIALWAFFGRDSAERTLGDITGWISTHLGWFYILTATVAVVFVLSLAFSSAGHIRLGPDHSRPQFRLFSWSAMLFAAGIGVDLMFFSVAEPVTQYMMPPEGAGETREAAEQAVVWALFHYGVTGWAMYALMGMAFGYYAYRLHMPLAIRSALYPLIGKRIHGPVGDAVDVAAVMGTVFGIAASLGIGVVQLNYGLHLIFGVSEGPTWQIILVVAGVGIAILSAVSGVDKGIKLLSEINVYLAMGLALYVVIAGKTSFLFDALVMNIGDYVSRFPGMTMDTFAFAEDKAAVTEWMGAWTLFFWAWWVAWAPFVGLFLARISRGRTLRQFVVGTLTIPFLFILGWLSFFGNTALERVIGGDQDFAQRTIDAPQQGFYDLLSGFPGGAVVIVLATAIGLLLYITSADSGALVTANFTSKTSNASQDGPKWLRVFWAALVGVLTIVMLQIDGVATVQSATIVMGLPFAVVMYLVMLGLVRSLRLESLQKEARSVSLHAAMSGRTGGSGTNHNQNWRRRLSRANTWPSADRAQHYLDTIAQPAMAAVAEELKDKGIEAQMIASSVQSLPVGQLDLYLPLGEEQDFRYQIYPIEHPVPSFTRSTGKDHKYYRLEVFDRTGSLGYDIFGYSREQLIDNILDLYERHLEFLHIQRDLPGTSDLSDGAAPVREWAEDTPD